MFDERRIICVYLVLFVLLPFVENNKDFKLIIPWIICTSLFFIFPFLSEVIIDNINLM